MPFLSILSRLVAFGSLLALPLSAEAAGGATISGIFTGLVTSFSGLWLSIAGIAIVVAGVTLMLSQQEGAIDKARSTIIAVMIGGIITVVILTLGSTSFISFMYNGAYNSTTLLTTGASNLGLQASGAGDWLTSMAAMLGIVIIVIAVVKAVTSFGGDEAAYTNVRNSIIQVVVGLIIIGAAYVFKTVFFPPIGTVGTPAPLISIVVGKIGIVFGFIAVIAVGILVFAGLRMLVSFGREEEYSAAKSLAIRVIVGLAVILLSYSLVLIVGTIF